MPSLRCYRGSFRQGLALPLPLALGQKSFAEYFHAVGRDSHGNFLIDPTFDDSRQHWANSPEPDAPTDAYLLHSALENLTGNYPEDPGLRNEIGLIYADRWEGDANVFGMMFDVGFEAQELGSVATYAKVAREGCAVFLEAIRVYRGSRGASESEIERQIQWTTLHELGHVFNLWHHDAPVRFMTSSVEGRIYDEAQADVEYDFREDQRLFLRDSLAAGLESDKAPHAWPGGEPFGTRGAGFSVDKEYYRPLDRPVSRSALELEIDMAQKEFWSIDPVELDIELRVPAQIRKRYRLPSHVDPGYASFAIWIEEPDGHRRRFRSPRHYCENPGEIRVAADEPFRRDISIFGQAGGYTFRQAGPHHIFITWTLPDGRRLESNRLEVKVKSRLEGRREWERRHPVLSDRDTALLLYHRNGPFRNRVVEPLEELATATEDPCLEADLRYALGRFLHRAGRGRSRDTRRRHHRRAHDHLARALDLGDALSPRRCDHAARVVEELESG